MWKKRIAATLLLLLFLASAAPAADTYAIDPVHSHIGFSARHMLLTNVHGQFKEFSGTILYDEKDVTKSSVKVVIKAISIDTEIERRDNHLRSADFLDVANHPEIAFESKQIEKRGESLVCIGTLTIRGVTREVAIPFTLLGPVKDPQGQPRVGIEGSLTLNRQDYGVSWSRTLDGGGLVVADELRISLSVEAVKQPPQEPR
mgnify:CR=1 FL=1